MFMSEDFEEGMDGYLDLTSVYPHPSTEEKPQPKGVRQSYYIPRRVTRKGNVAKNIQRAIQRALDREKN